ncbi:hypothetical protein BJ165DRAFT_1348337 [Panaeolus papilionaceus]|nr:hypothetical protein BJ165DRAFT_1348337 [Panaeolus papilionaceus]
MAWCNSFQSTRRFFSISTFGNGTIRKFPANSSEMKKMAARDFEDLLQCSIPVFKGLLDEPHNARVSELLYVMAEWHALAKLRIHTDTSLALLQATTTKFGESVRRFRDTTCLTFQTLELPREAAARARRELAAAMATPTSTTNTGSRRHSPSTRKTRNLNLRTVKMHFLGDYVDHIRSFGTSDSYSTQLVSFFIFFFRHSN